MHHKLQKRSHVWSRCTSKFISAILRGFQCWKITFFWRWLAMENEQAIFFFGAGAVNLALFLVMMFMMFMFHSHIFLKCIFHLLTMDLRVSLKVSTSEPVLESWTHPKIISLDPYTRAVSSQLFGLFHHYSKHSRLNPMIHLHYILNQDNLPKRSSLGRCWKKNTPR